MMIAHHVPKSLNDQLAVVDRSVETRSPSRMTSTNTSLYCSTTDNDTLEQQRGWRSPHGEPYRPLGNPALHLKFTPRVPHGGLTVPSGHRLKLLETSSVPVPVPNKEEVTRGSTLTTDHSVSPIASSRVRPVNALDGFPRNLHHRSPHDRQVKLAMRLQQSMAQYSPENIRALKRSSDITITAISSVPTDPFVLQDGDMRILPSSPRPHVQHGDPSLKTLREAIQEGGVRLKLVKNGVNMLETVPPVSPIDFPDLQHEYQATRMQYLLNRRTLPEEKHHHERTESTRRLSTTEETRPMHAPMALPNDTEEKEEEIRVVYLSYIDRSPQKSPHKKLPSFAEFKATMRVPVRPSPNLRSSPQPTNRENMNNHNRSKSSRRFGPTTSLLSKISTTPVVGTSPSSDSSPSLRQSISGRQGNGSTSRMVRNSTANCESIIENSPRGPVPPSSSSPFSLLPQTIAPPKLHSIQRLQVAVDALEATKKEHSKTLVKTLETLSQDRRDCLWMKYKNLHITQHLEVDLVDMRRFAEIQREDQIEENMNKYRWYSELMRQLAIARETTPLHPAEVFILQAIQQIASNAQVFQVNHLYQVILLLHPDDLAVTEVQQVLLYLRRVLSIPVSQWQTFFRTHHLVEPTEGFKPKENIKKEKKLRRMSKLRGIVKMNMLFRTVGGR